VIGGTLLGTTAFASANTASGYETYKNALLNMRNVKSMTDTIKVSASDNGASLLSVDAAMKMNKDSKAMSGSVDIKAGNVEKEKDIYRQNDKAITKDSDSDTYNVIEFTDGQAGNQERKPDEKLTEKRVQNLENIVDSLIGNRQNYFVLKENNDGTKNVNVKLSENQIMPVANAVVSAIIRDRESMAVGNDKLQNKQNIELPKLDKDIRITNVDLTAVIDKNGIISEQKGTLTLTGKDISGTEHTLVLNIDMNITNVNGTTPDTVNLDGKQVKVVTPSEFKHIR
jgi:hypothetical protein